MRQLTEREITIVSGGMMPVSTFGVQHRVEPNHSSTFTAQAGPFHLLRNTGTELSCQALGAGAAPIGGTAAAIGAVAITKNPAIAGDAYRIGAAVTAIGTTALCHGLENAQFRH